MTREKPARHESPGTATHYLAEAGIGSHHGCYPSTPRTQVVHVHGYERATTGSMS